MHLRSKDSESTAEWKFDRAAAAPLDRRSLARTMARALLPLVLLGAGTLASALFPQKLLAQANSAPTTQPTPVHDSDGSSQAGAGSPCADRRPRSRCLARSQTAPIVRAPAAAALRRPGDRAQGARRQASPCARMPMRSASTPPSSKAPAPCSTCPRTPSTSTRTAFRRPSTTSATRTCRSRSAS